MLQIEVHQVTLLFLTQFPLLAAAAAVASIIHPVYQGVLVVVLVEREVVRRVEPELRAKEIMGVVKHSPIILVVEEAQALSARMMAVTDLHRRFRARLLPTLVVVGADKKVAEVMR